jgi:hypothetical protein
VRKARRNRPLITALSFLTAAISLAALPATASAAAGQPGSWPAGSRSVRPAAAAAARTPAVRPVSAAAAPAGERRVCPAATRPGQMECQSVYRPAGRGPNASAFASTAVSPVGFGPPALRSAYGLASAARTRGHGKVVAIVDAYRDPHAAADLARYRSHFRLRACTTSSGCLRIVNQKGKSGPLPRANKGWAIEESLDLDMVSAICPKCRILLVEASSSSTASLGKAENAAVAKGARFVSNSWSGNEFAGESVSNHYFNHPGDAIVFASGDDGYGTVYPTDLQYVTAVGGTTLTHRQSGGRAWTETVWSGTGSGCSPLTAKPSWQHQPVDIGAGGCPRRTENDVAAVADPDTGVAVYDTYRTGGTWGLFGGTSVATPIITAVYALAGNPARRSYPASYLYQHLARFHDVRSGANGTCPAVSAYLCHGETGYDGPTGLGTPRGTYGFSHGSTDPVTLVDPGTKSAAAGASVRLTITGLDTRAAATSLAYSATGLPAGLSIGPVRGTTNGVVTGTVSPAITAGTVFSVVVTAKDRKTSAQGKTRFTFRVT